MASNSLGVALAVFVSGCTSAPTQLVVLVDSDYAVPDELATVHALVSAPDGEVVSEHTFTLSGSATPGASRFTLPLSFGMVPVDDDASRRVDCVVEGMDPAGRVLVARRALTGFIEEQTLLLPMYLLRSCASVVCPQGQTCTERGCVPAAIDPPDLPRVTPGDELDASLRPTDAGPLDGSPADAAVWVDRCVMALSGQPDADASCPSICAAAGQTWNAMWTCRAQNVREAGCTPGSQCVCGCVD